MQETNGDGRPLNRPGLYRQKETGQEIYLEGTPGLGTPIIDAFVQAGFVFISDQKPVVIASAPSSGYTESHTKNGQIQYRHNGKLVSEEEYINNQSLRV